ncbi:Disease resistance protein L6 [Linum perenne]
MASLVLPLVLLYKLWYGRRSSDGSNNNDNGHTDSTFMVDQSSITPDSADPSSSLSFPSVEYEVFLSFRGPDTRHQITDILYRFLIHIKIHTFKDDDELRKGERIWSNLVKAIDQSKIYIPIISKSYAHSKWQGAISDEVSSSVWSHLSKYNYALDIDELIGIDDHVEAVVEKLSMDSENMIMVGIHENIRETQDQKRGIVIIQEKLTSDILRMDSIRVSNDDEGRRMIKDRICRFKTLIILDDVDEKFKFEDVLGSPKNFHHGRGLPLTLKGSNLIKGLRVENLSIGMDAIESLTNLSELRYFKADLLTTLVQDFNNFLPNLRWLQLHRYNRFNHEECEPPLISFNMKNLVILDIRASCLPDNWGGWSQIQMAERLKLIDLSHCSKFQRLPRFPRSVEILKLNNIEGQEIPELDIGDLKKLKVLYLNYSKLQKITGGTFGMLKGLQELDLTDFECKNLREVMVDVGELSSLKILRTKGSREVEYETPIGLKELSTSSRISNLAEMLELEVLKIYDCKFGFDIPPMWWNVSKLKFLSIDNTNINGGGSSSNNNMITTTMLPSSLTYLQIYQCHAWLPSLVNLGNLTYLEMVSCQTLCNHLDGIERMTSLKNLLIYGVKGLARIIGLTDLLFSTNCKLESLVIVKCPDLIELHDDDKAAEVGVVVNSLRIMNIVHCPLLDVGPLVRGLTTFPMLWVLCLENIKFTEHKLEGVGSLQELEYCFLKLPSLERITPLSKLQKLKRLIIAGAHGLREIEGLGELKCLETLILANCTSLERLWHADDRLENLKKLDIRNCRSLSVEHLSALEAGLPPNVEISWPDEPCEDEEIDSRFILFHNDYTIISTFSIFFVLNT